MEGVTNLIAYDKKASRLYLWESHTHSLHCISVHLGDPDDPTSILASSSSKVLQPDVHLSFVVSNISINKNGSALLLSGDHGLCVMYLFGRNSTKDNTIICRTVSVESQFYFENHNSIRTLQIWWHPISDTHLGILSSDSVFRLFDLSSDLEKPEQEYYLEPVEPKKCRNVASICPVGFSFVVGESGSSVALRAHPYVPFDVSLSLQGPLRKVCHGDEEDSEIQGTTYEGRAVGLLYNIISKDSILVTSWSSGQLQIDTLADEIQPVWNVGNPTRICVDSHDHILGVAMICESTLGDLWLLWIWLFVDPFIPERIYCLHGGGVDSIVIHFQPFTSQESGIDEVMKSPSVYSILSTSLGKTSSPSALSGFLALEDSLGYSWIVAVTFSQECLVLEMKDWNISLPIHVDREKKGSLDEFQEKDTPGVLSKELLDGPNVVLIPQASPNLYTLVVDSIEGRSALHQYFKFFHENYVEYAHKKVIDKQKHHLHKAQQDLSKVERQPSLDDRINHALEVHCSLEDRLQTLRNLHRAHKKPLSRAAELDFKTELDRFTGLELGALCSSVEALNAEGKKDHTILTGYGRSKFPRRQFPGRRKNPVPESQVSQLRSAVEKLSLVNSETLKKVKLVESALSKIESKE
ncbi:hypothetical protein MKX01_016474 [Papaver californicum]|nr:hypothetical protein MKX01_016474 [Papaver californicum]